MKTGTRAVVGLTLVLAALAAGNAAAQDSPQWRGPNRDGTALEFQAPSAWPKQLVRKWKTTVGQGDATPALVGKKLFVFTRVGGNEIIACLDAETGKELWKDKYPALAVKGPAAPHGGPRSSPAVADGKVVTLGVNGILSCTEAETGKKLWRNKDFTKAVPTFSVAMSPLIAEGLCVVHLGGKGRGMVVAFELASGEIKWKWQGEGPAYASPVLFTSEKVTQVVLQTESHLRALALADGAPLWQVATPTVGQFCNAVSPVVDVDNIIYTGQGAGIKSVKIEKDAKGFTAKEDWTCSDLGTAYNTPVRKALQLYGLSDRGKFFCMDSKTGRIRWTDTVLRGPFGAIVDVGPALVALPASGELVVIRPTEQRFEEMARIKVADPPTYATPVFSGKNIFIKDKETVAMWTFE